MTWDEFVKFWMNERRVLFDRDDPYIRAVRELRSAPVLTPVSPKDYDRMRSILTGKP